MCPTLCLNPVMDKKSGIDWGHKQMHTHSMNGFHTKTKAGREGREKELEFNGNATSKRKGNYFKIYLFHSLTHSLSHSLSLPLSLSLQSEAKRKLSFGMRRREYTYD